LAVYPDNNDDFYLRSVFYSNEENGTLTFAGNVEEGATVQISHSTKERILDACNDSIKHSLSSFKGGKIETAICFSCTGRKAQLGTQISKEIDLLKSNQPDLQFFGFYSFGEFSPFHNDKPSFFHNGAFVTLLIGEE